MIRPVHRSGPEAGSAAIALVAAAALALVVFVALANVVTMQFTRNAARAAVEEAARAGSRSDAPVGECEARARAVLDGLLGPAAREGVAVTCALVGDPPVVRAQAAVEIVPWLPGLSRWSLAIRSEATQEVLP